jgi:alkanesulfonate monooxygenase SsuD/methylene tetrahydromethanopterin reductase-like flavin-dependent oxidoreductase (luciferase family)
MAAASQRTSRIELGTAVIPLGLENPFRLAEDLATVDILSGGRINPAVSVGTPMLYDRYEDALYPGTSDVEDFSKERVLRLLRALRGEPVGDLGRRAGHQLPDQLRGQHRWLFGRHRIPRLRHHSGPEHRRLPGRHRRPPPAPRKG